MADEKITEELHSVMRDAMLKLQSLVNQDLSRRDDFLPIINTFLSGVVSTTADLVELQIPGGALEVYADVESLAKTGGFRAIRSEQSPNSHLSRSVSGIAPDDMVGAMNYIGQELSTTLFKTIHELPVPLKKPEMFLRGIEALITGLLIQKFNNPHDVLDSLCEHIHLALEDLETRKPKSTH